MFSVGKCFQIAVCLNVKNSEEQTNPPPIEIISQTAKLKCVYTVKYCETPIQESS